jgi:hypothetical protein
MAALSTIAATAIGAAGVGATMSASKRAASSARQAGAIQQQTADQGVQLQREQRAIAEAELRPWAAQGQAANKALAALVGVAPSGEPRIQGGPSPEGPAEQPRPSFSERRRAARAARGVGGDPYGDVLGEAPGPPMQEEIVYNPGGSVFAAPQATGTAAAPAPTAPAPIDMSGREAPMNSGLSVFAPRQTNPAAAGFNASPFGTMADDAAATFEQSPWYAIASREAGRAVGDLDARYGASGMMLSGQATRARAELMNDMIGGAFDRHYAARAGNFSDYADTLSALAGQGFSASSGIASAGQNFANNASSLLASGAQARGNAAIAAGQARQQGASDLLGFAGFGLGLLQNRKRATPVSRVTPSNIPVIPLGGGFQDYPTYVTRYPGG